VPRWTPTWCWWRSEGTRHYASIWSRRKIRVALRRGSADMSSGGPSSFTLILEHRPVSDIAGESTSSLRNHDHTFASKGIDDKAGHAARKRGSGRNFL